MLQVWVPHHILRRGPPWPSALPCHLPSSLTHLALAAVLEDAAPVRLWDLCSWSFLVPDPLPWVSQRSHSWVTSCSLRRQSPQDLNSPGSTLGFHFQIRHWIMWLPECYFSIISPSFFLPPKWWSRLTCVWIPSNRHPVNRTEDVTCVFGGTRGQRHGEISLRVDLEEWMSKNWPGRKFLRTGNLHTKFDNVVFKAYRIWKKIF